MIGLAGGKRTCVMIAQAHRALFSDRSHGSRSSEEASNAMARLRSGFQIEEQTSAGRG
jgi:hypothetical protein